MVKEIDIPGTDNTVNPMDLSGSAMTLVTTVIGFAIAAMAASIGTDLWNRVSQTSDALDEVELL